MDAFITRPERYGLYEGRRWEAATTIEERVGGTEDASRADFDSLSDRIGTLGRIQEDGQNLRNRM